METVKSTSNGSSGYQCYLQLDWTESNVSIDGNSSVINWTLYKKCVSNNAYSYSYGAKAVINGTTVFNDSSTKPNATSDGSLTLGSGSITIPHDADGSKSVSITLSGAFYTASYTVSGTGTATLTTIARATTPTLSSSSFDMNSSITISTARASSSFTHTLTYTFGSLSGTIATNVGTSTTWTVPLSLANAIPNATSGTGSITCQTYNGSTLIGTKSVTFTANVPSSVVPTISSVSVTESVEGIASKFNAFVQNKSMLNVSISASGAYSSTISKYETYIQSVSYLGSSFTSSLITASGSIGVVTIVTDSRGRTSQVSNTITVLAYTTPVINTFSAYRCDNDGNMSDEGTKAYITVNFNISTVNNLNDKYYEILYKVKGATSWAGTLASGNIYSRNDSFISSSVFDVDNTYELTVRIWDYFVSDSNGINATIDIPSAFTLFDCRSTGKGIAFGKVSEKDEMEIAMDLDLTGEFIQEDIQTPTLLNSWVNYGSGYESASYFKDKCGVVHIAGFIKSGTITDGTVIFTLPDGYRPRASEKFIVVSLNAICVLDIYGNGNLTIRAGANSGWLSLSGISFRAN